LTIALYPGSFDPVTNGHIDIATRATTLFEQLIIGVYDAPPKSLLFTTEERAELWRQAVAHLPNTRVEPYTGLTVEFAHKVKARVIVRGLRMSSDFEQEFEMALMNKKLAPDLEVVCLMTNLEYEFLSASLLKEVARLGGCIQDLVPEHVAVALKRKFDSR
jgi:pantetheine-phosphate adenylyltransferase